MEIKDYTDYDEEEILRLYSSVHWTAYTDHPDALRMGFAHSLRILAAYEGTELLGLIRVVGDGQTVVLIQDLLVFPEHQRKGVGSSLLRAILEQYSAVRQIQLATDNTQKNLTFYRSMGFVPMTELGCVGLAYERTLV